MLTAIIVAAGTSQRMGFDKLFADLGNRPVVAHSIAAFQACPAVGSIVLVTRPEKKTVFQELARTEGWTKLHAVLSGGAQRHLSVWNGLQTLVDDTAGAAESAGAPASAEPVGNAVTFGHSAEDFQHFVAVHDGARPLVTPDMIERCLDMAQQVGAACCAAPVCDTIKRADANRHIAGSIDRTNLWAMQTPQIFSLPLLLRAYKEVIAAGRTVTDETSAMDEIGQPVALLNSGDFNLKITYPQDLELARHLLALKGN